MGKQWSLYASKLKCNNCNNIIQSKHRHDFVRCDCGDTFLDGGIFYQRWGGTDVTDMSEWLDVEENVVISPTTGKSWGLGADGLIESRDSDVLPYHVCCGKPKRLHDVKHGIEHVCDDPRFQDD